MKTAFTYGLEAWANITKEEIKELERKRKTFEAGISTLNNNIIYRVVDGNEDISGRMQYAILMYHNIQNSNEDRNTEQSINEKKNN